MLKLGQAPSVTVKGSVEDTDAHDKRVLGVKGDIFAIPEDGRAVEAACGVITSASPR